MDADAPGARPGAARPTTDAKPAQSDEHEHDVEEREAFEAWGYMFNTDKTGTHKLKALLRGLKAVIVSEHPGPPMMELVGLIDPRMNITSRQTTQT
jgi:hypothetical protein